MHSKKHSLAKSVCWRLFSVLILWIITYAITGSIPKSTAITFVHHGIFLFVYWLHERIWLKFTNQKYKSIIKAFTYEIVIAIPVLSLISWIFTGDLFKAVSISVTYVIFKVILYVIYEKLWNRVFFRPVIYMDMVGDLFHIGHLNAICEARRQGSIVVGLLTDKGASAYKRKPVIPFSQRARIILNIKGVDLIMEQRNLTTDVLENMKSCKADYFLHGDDWNYGNQRKRKRYLMDRGIKIVEIPYTKGISTSKILAKLKRKSLF